MKKYELTAECKTLDNGTKLFRIKALRDFSNVKAGDLGGWVEKEGNLSQEGNAWWNDNSYNIYGSHPWVVRGAGNSSGANSGVFSFASIGAGGWTSGSFRSVLTAS